MHVGAFAGMMNEHISKGAVILKQANVPQCGVTRRDFDKEPYPMWYLRSTSRNRHFAGMFSLANDKKPSKYQQWHSQQRSDCASIQFGNEKQRHMVTQLAAFANKRRWHIAPSDKENLMKAALF